MEDDVKVLEYMGANKAAAIEIVPNVAVPEELISSTGMVTHGTRSARKIAAFAPPTHRPWRRFVGTATSPTS